MENRYEIVKELRDISPLVADIQPVTPFTVPDGYFTALPEMVLEKLKREALLTGAAGNTYGVPAGYFDALPGNILAKIKSNSSDTREELAEIAPLLNTISRREVYAVPSGYFANTDFAGSAQAAKPQAKLVGMRRANKWMQYVAAAMMAGVLVTGAFLYTDTNSTGGNAQYEPVDLSLELNKVNAEELVTYLNNPEHAAGTTVLASEATLTDVKTHIQKLSDEELNNYLKENADPLDNTGSEKEN
jgi:hypothetical protein